MATKQRSASAEKAQGRAARMRKNAEAAKDLPAVQHPSNEDAAAAGDRAAARWPELLRRLGE